MSLQSRLNARNRRTGKRKMLRGEAVVQCGETHAYARLWDVGLDGMCLLTKRPMSPGTRCAATFQVPINGAITPVTAQVKVVFSSFSGPDGFKLGVVFVDLSKDAAELISQFVATG